MFRYCILISICLLFMVSFVGCPTTDNPKGPTANFTATPVTGNAPLEVTFKDKSERGESPIDTWIWDFGDGTDGGDINEQHPVHTYGTPGEYNVSLTVTTASGEDTETKKKYITVDNTTGPIAQFTATPVTGNAPLEVTFTDTSQPGESSIDTWFWDFGDGTGSTDQNPVHTYVTPDEYSVSLTITTAVDTDTEIKETFITVGNYAGLIAEFTATPVTGNAPLEVTFTDTSQQGESSIDTWFWDFGDGTGSTDQNPVHTYVMPGEYNISLTITAVDESDEEIKETYIIVNADGGEGEGEQEGEGGFVAPTPNFSSTVSIGEPPLVIQFTDESVPGSDPITDWLWDFGDDTTSTERNPVHTYEEYGTYDVSLTVNHSYRISSHNHVNIRPDAAPTARFRANPNSGFPPLQVEFTDESEENTSPITSWEWDFGDGEGDGEMETEQNPSHVFTEVGEYIVTLRVTSDDGSSYTTEVINVLNLVPAFSASQTSGNVPATILFTDQSTGDPEPDSLLWDFGDEETSAARNPEHTFTTPDTYTVTLTVSSALGSSSTSQDINIGELEPDFKVDATTGESYLTVNFTDLSSGDPEPESWFWDFGDGETSMEIDPTHEYSDIGQYSVTLIIANDYGFASTTKTDLISVTD